MAWSVYALHRRPDLYGMDAEIFRPERWDEEMSLNKDEVSAKWGYLPFNGGPRICLGSKLIFEFSAVDKADTLQVDFALTEAAYTVVRILQRFPQITLPIGSIPELTGVEKQTMTLVLSITEGCKVELR